MSDTKTTQASPRTLRIALFVGWLTVLAVVFLSTWPELLRAAVFAGACIATLLIQKWAPRMASLANTTEVDALGVRRSRAGEVFEEINWADLVRVSVMTTDDGPFGEDFFFLLFGHDGSGCLVPQGDALRLRLLARLQRLPGFDNMAVIMASGSVENADFLCWEGPPASAMPASQDLPEEPADSQDSD